MSIRKMTVLLHGGARDRIGLDLGLELARRTGAHIDAVQLALGPAELATFRDRYYPDFPHDMEAQYLRACRDLADRSRRQFEAWREEKGMGEVPAPDRLSATWREDARSADDAARRLGRFTDLVIAPRPNGRLSALSRFILEGLLFASGHPTLLVPPAGAVPCLEVAVVAWNGSAEATHAVTAALPLLAGMRRVAILVVDEPLAPDPEADQLAEYLSWHGITADVVRVLPGRPIGILLLEEATRLRADLLVMGAYTHHPTREQLLGGATLHMLKHADIPVLMAH